MTKLTVNEKALKALEGKVTYDHPMLAWFKPYIDNWGTKAGPMPTPAELMAGRLTGKQGAGRQTGFVALQLRTNGCTIGELRDAFNAGPAHNHTNDLVDLKRDGVSRGAGYFDRLKVGSGEGQNQRYSLTFTEKGEAWLAEAMIAAGLKAAPKAKAPTKAPKAVKVTRKRNQAAPVAPAETPTSDAPSATEGQPVETGAENYTEAQLRDAEAAYGRVSEAALAELHAKFNG